MPPLNTQTHIRIHCEKGSRTLVLDAEDVREIVNTLIRQNMLQFNIENLPDYRQDHQRSGKYRGVPYEAMCCHAAYAIVETTECGAEVIAVSVDVQDGFIDACYHEVAEPTPDLATLAAQTPAIEENVWSYGADRCVQPELTEGSSNGE